MLSRLFLSCCALVASSESLIHFIIYLSVNKRENLGLAELSLGLAELSPGLAELSPGLAELSPGLAELSPGNQKILHFSRIF